LSDLPIELHQFSHSHFNEKVRWALDYKGVLHTRTNYIPGPHLPQIRRLSGQGQVPVLGMDGRVLHGSATILDAIEQRFPTPPLYPSQPSAREEALALQAKLDAGLGPEVRRAVFDATLDESPTYVAETFAGEKPPWKRTLFVTAFPVIRALMKKSMNITPTTGQRAQQRVDELLEWMAAKVEATGYLVGDSFTVADLTAAALLGPILRVEHPDMKHPSPEPPRFRALCDRWGEHPATVWATEVYRKHRPPRRGIVIG
jgi:glutathione S-transferase